MSNRWNPNELSLRLPYSLEDMELIGDQHFSIGVPRALSNDFKRRVLAAGKSYFAGTNSVDYMLKRYGGIWDFDAARDPTLDILMEATATAKRQVSVALTRAMEIENKPDQPSLFACSAALYRLQNTFWASMMCIHSFMHFEAAALLRIILEQLAWMYRIRSLPESADFFKVSPRKCITHLKELFPYAGALYGQLSGVSHIEPKETRRYILVEDSGLAIQLSDRDLSRNDAFQLLILTDMYAVLSEWLYADLEKPNILIQTEDGKWRPDPARPFLATVRRYQELLLGVQKGDG